MLYSIDIIDIIAPFNTHSHPTGTRHFVTSTSRRGSAVLLVDGPQKLGHGSRPATVATDKEFRNVAATRRDGSSYLKKIPNQGSTRIKPGKTRVRLILTMSDKITISLMITFLMGLVR